MTTSVPEWLRRYSTALGVDPPSESEQETLLELAATSAHASDRIAAPMSCWLAARSGKPTAEALQVAVALAGEIGGSS